MILAHTNAHKESREMAPCLQAGTARPCADIRTEFEKQAIVFAEVVTVKSEPKAASQDVFVLHAGTKVNVLESLNNYKKIQLLDLKEGWIDKSAIKELKD